MHNFKDTGLAFRKVELNEADTIYSILTRFHGRIEAIAKGIRKLKSRKRGNIDLLTESNLSFAKGRNLDIITEAELIDDFSNVKDSLDKTYTLFYICNLLSRFLQPGDDYRFIYDLVIKLLKLLSSDYSPLYLRAFELHFLSINGYEPDTTVCQKCGKSLSESSLISVDPINTGFTCQCSKNRLKVDKVSIKTIKYMKTHPIQEAVKIDLSKKQSKLLKRITQMWIESITSKEFSREHL